MSAPLTAAYTLLVPNNTTSALYIAPSPYNSVIVSDTSAGALVAATYSFDSGLNTTLYGWYYGNYNEELIQIYEINTSSGSVKNVTNSIVDIASTSLVFQTPSTGSFATYFGTVSAPLTGTPPTFTPFGLAGSTVTTAPTTYSFRMTNVKTNTKYVVLCLSANNDTLASSDKMLAITATAATSSTLPITRQAWSSNATKSATTGLQALLYTLQNAFQISVGSYFDISKCLINVIPKHVNTTGTTAGAKITNANYTSYTLFEYTFVAPATSVTIALSTDTALPASTKIYGIFTTSGYQRITTIAVNTGKEAQATVNADGTITIGSSVFTDTASSPTLTISGLTASTTYSIVMQTANSYTDSLYMLVQNGTVPVRLTYAYAGASLTRFLSYTSLFPETTTDTTYLSADTNYQSVATTALAVSTWSFNSGSNTEIWGWYYGGNANDEECILIYEESTKKNITASATELSSVSFKTPATNFTTPFGTFSAPLAALPATFTPYGLTTTTTTIPSSASFKLKSLSQNTNYIVVAISGLNQAGVDKNLAFTTTANDQITLTRQAWVSHATPSATTGPQAVLLSLQNAYRSSLSPLTYTDLSVSFANLIPKHATTTTTTAATAITAANQSSYNFFQHNFTVPVGATSVSISLASDAALSAFTKITRIVETSSFAIMSSLSVLKSSQVALSGNSVSITASGAFADTLASPSFTVSGLTAGTTYSIIVESTSSSTENLYAIVSANGSPLRLSYAATAGVYVSLLPYTSLVPENGTGATYIPSDPLYTLAGAVSNIAIGTWSINSGSNTELWGFYYSGLTLYAEENLYIYEASTGKNITSSVLELSATTFQSASSTSTAVPSFGSITTIYNNTPNTFTPFGIYATSTAKPTAPTFKLKNLKQNEVYIFLHTSSSNDTGADRALAITTPSINTITLTRQAWISAARSADTTAQALILALTNAYQTAPSTYLDLSTTFTNLLPKHTSVRGTTAATAITSANKASYTLFNTEFTLPAGSTSVTIALATDTVLPSTTYIAGIYNQSTSSKISNTQITINNSNQVILNGDGSMNISGGIFADAISGTSITLTGLTSSTTYCIFVQTANSDADNLYAIVRSGTTALRLKYAASGTGADLPSAVLAVTTTEKILDRTFTNLIPDTYPGTDTNITQYVINPAPDVSGNRFYGFRFTCPLGVTSVNAFITASAAATAYWLLGVFDANGTNYVGTANITLTSGVSQVTPSIYTTGISFTASTNNTTSTPNFTINNLTPGATYTILTGCTKNSSGTDIGLVLEVPSIFTPIPITYVMTSRFSEAIEVYAGVRKFVNVFPTAGYDGSTYISGTFMHGFNFTPTATSVSFNITKAVGDISASQIFIYDTFYSVNMSTYYGRNIFTPQAAVAFIDVNDPTSYPMKISATGALTDTLAFTVNGLTAGRKYVLLTKGALPTTGLSMYAYSGSTGVPLDYVFSSSINTDITPFMSSYMRFLRPMWSYWVTPSTNPIGSTSGPPVVFGFKFRAASGLGAPLTAYIYNSDASANQVILDIYDMALGVSIYNMDWISSYGTNMVAGTNAAITTLTGQPGFYTTNTSFSSNIIDINFNSEILPTNRDYLIVTAITGTVSRTAASPYKGLNMSLEYGSHVLPMTYEFGLASGTNLLRTIEATYGWGTSIMNSADLAVKGAYRFENQFVAPSSSINVSIDSPYVQVAGSKILGVYTYSTASAYTRVGTISIVNTARLSLDGDGYISLPTSSMINDTSNTSFTISGLTAGVTYSLLTIRGRNTYADLYARITANGSRVTINPIPLQTAINRDTVGSAVRFSSLVTNPPPSTVSDGSSYGSMTANVIFVHRFTTPASSSPTITVEGFASATYSTEEAIIRIYEQDTSSNILETSSNVSVISPMVRSTFIRNFGTYDISNSLFLNSSNINTTNIPSFLLNNLKPNTTYTLVVNSRAIDNMTTMDLRISLEFMVSAMNLTILAASEQQSSTLANRAFLRLNGVATRAFTNMVPDTVPNMNTTHFFSYTFVANSDTTANQFGFYAKTGASVEEQIVGIYRRDTSTNLIATNTSTATSGLIAAIQAGATISGSTISFAPNLDNRILAPQFRFFNAVSGETYYIVIQTTKNDAGQDLGLAITSTEKGNHPLTYFGTSTSQSDLVLAAGRTYMPTPPSSITLSAGGAGSGYVDVSWGIPIDTGGQSLTYTVQWVDGNGTTGSAPTTSRSYRITGLRGGTISVTVLSNGAYSSTGISSTTSFIGAPDAPTGVTVTAGAYGAATVSWTAPTFTAGGSIVYDISWNDGVSSGSAQGVSSGYALSNLYRGTLTATVTARNDTYSSLTASATGSGSVDGTLVAPASLTASEGGLESGIINLGWAAPSNLGSGSVSFYDISWNNTNTQVSADVSSTSLSYQLTGITGGTTTFQVRAYNGGYSAYSTVKSFAVPSQYDLSFDPVFPGTTPLSGYIKHSFIVPADQTSLYVFLKTTATSHDEELLFFLYRQDTSSNMISDTYITNRRGVDISDGLLVGVEDNTLSFPVGATEASKLLSNFTLTGVSAGTYYLIAKTTQNDDGDDVGMSIQTQSYVKVDLTLVDSNASLEELLKSAPLSLDISMGATTATFSWAEPSFINTAATSITGYRYKVVNGPIVTQEADVSAASIVITGLTRATPYAFSVAAYFDSVLGPYADISGTTGISPPYAFVSIVEDAIDAPAFSKSGMSYARVDQRLKYSNNGLVYESIPLFSRQVTSMEGGIYSAISEVVGIRYNGRQFVGACMPAANNPEKFYFDASGATTPAEDNGTLFYSDDGFTFTITDISEIVGEVVFPTSMIEWSNLMNKWYAVVEGESGDYHLVESVKGSVWAYTKNISSEINDASYLPVQMLASSTDLVILAKKSVIAGGAIKMLRTTNGTSWTMTDFTAYATAGNHSIVAPNGSVDDSRSTVTGAYRFFIGVDSSGGSKIPVAYVSAGASWDSHILPLKPSADSVVVYAANDTTYMFADSGGSGSGYRLVYTTDFVNYSYSSTLETLLDQNPTYSIEDLKWDGSNWNLYIHTGLHEEIYISATGSMWVKTGLRTGRILGLSGEDDVVFRPASVDVAITNSIANHGSFTTPLVSTPAIVLNTVAAPVVAGSITEAVDEQLLALVPYAPLLSTAIIYSDYAMQSILASVLTFSSPASTILNVGDVKIERYEPADPSVATVFMTLVKDTSVAGNVNITIATRKFDSAGEPVVLDNVDTVVISLPKSGGRTISVTHIDDTAIRTPVRYGIDMESLEIDTEVSLNVGMDAKVKRVADPDSSTYSIEYTGPFSGTNIEQQSAFNSLDISYNTAAFTTSVPKEYVAGDVLRFALNQKPVSVRMKVDISAGGQSLFSQMGSTTDLVLTYTVTSGHVGILGSATSFVVVVSMFDEDGVTPFSMDSLSSHPSGVKSANTLTLTKTWSNGGGGGGGGGGIPCIVEGQRILTPTGYRRVEELRQGDLIKTADGRIVRSKIYRTVVEKTTKETAPVRIGPLRISPNHAFKINKYGWHLPGLAADYGLASAVREAPGARVVYYHVETPNYLSDNLIVEGKEIESFGPRFIKANKIDPATLFTLSKKGPWFIRRSAGYAKSIHI